MSRPPAGNRPPTKDMYWFAHGGVESANDKCLNQRGDGEDENCDSTSPKSLTDRRSLPEDPKFPIFSNSVVDGSGSSGPSSLEIKGDQARNIDKRMAAEERRKQLWEAEQERNDAVLRKHMEREAALEARRNAQRSHISFAFGSSVPRNVESLSGGDSEKINKQSNASGLSSKEENHETLHYRRSVSPVYYSGYNRLEVDGTSLRPHSPQSNFNSERKVFPPPCWLVGSGALIGDDVMSRSMTAAVPAPRGRRKNDLMPTVPYDRTPAPKTFSGCTRKRSVSMTRLDQLAQPRKHYVEANKASSTVSSGASSVLKDHIKSPTRPLSSASEQSGGSGRLGSSAIRRVRSSPRKPRPVSIAGTVPDHKVQTEARESPLKKISAVSKKPQIEVKKAATVSSKPSVEKCKSTSRAASAPKPAKPITSTPKPNKQVPSPKPSSSPKTPTAKKTVTNKKKADIISSQASPDVAVNQMQESIKSSSPPDSPPPESATSDADRNNAKRIISEEEAKTALAEKRKLAREQAEKEAELERQQQEELRLQEEERLRLEEEEQRRMEEEQLRLLEEHRKVEEEKLRKAIEENERKEEEERLKREEEQRLKAEQEKKAQEEAEKQRIELEEKLRKEEEERAERKKRLEKIMSRTRGKTTGISPSGSMSGSEQLDSSENQQENLSSGANSLDSNGPAEIASGPASLEAQEGKSEPVSDGASMEAHPTYEVTSDNESLHDIVMPKSETASQDNSLVILPEKEDIKVSVSDLLELEVDSAVLPASETAQLEVEPAVSNFEVSASAFNVSEDVMDEPIENLKKDMLMGDQVDVCESVTEVDSVKFQSDSAKNEENMPVSEAHVDHSEVAATAVDHSEVAATAVDHSEVAATAVDHSEVAATAVDHSEVAATAVDHSEVAATAVDHSEVAIAVDHSEVILSFEDSNNIVSDSMDATIVVEPEVVQTSEQIVLEAEIEQTSQFSTSSDMKLPDPIYETSDEGSVSSEKHVQDGNFGFQEHHHHESQLMTDEVFNEGEVSFPVGTNLNPFEKNNISLATDFMAAYESQFDVGGTQDSIYAYETSDARLPDVIEQPREMEEENIYPARSSTSSIVLEANEVLDLKTNTVFPNIDENKENIDDAFTSHQSNPFGTGANEFDAFSNKENMQLLSDGVIIDNVSESKDVLPESLNVDNKIQQGSSENFFLQQEFAVSEKVDQDNQSVTIESSSDCLESSNITIIKAEDSNDCVGIISSIDHDHISNDLTKQQNIQNEQCKSNFEYSSITDSEDSSLDSNLSQVMTEVSEKDSIGLNNGTPESATMKNGQTTNPFSEVAINGNTDSKSNGDHLFSETEIFRNGHRLEPSPPTVEQIGDYMLDSGKHISSVDHSKTNIFDSVGAVDFGKMSPDPFLAKGNPNPNPFLLPDEQTKQVHLMTPDFFN